MDIQPEFDFHIGKLCTMFITLVRPSTWSVLRLAIEIPAKDKEKFLNSIDNHITETYNGFVISTITCFSE